MTTIIAGRFQTSEETDRTVARLVERSIARDRISVFYVMPPGQHDATPIGGDEAKSPGADHAEQGAGTGAIIGAGLGVAGALVGVTAGLAAPLVAAAALGVAGAGAYSGSLAGAMNATTEQGPKEIRHAGMIVAVDAGAAGSDDVVIETLRDCGAIDVESAEGVWAGGTWEDFDPIRPPRLLHPSTP